MSALKRAVLGGALALSISLAQAQPVDAGAEAFVSCAAQNTARIRDDADLAALKGIVGSTRVVALGEPAHGAREPLRLRNRTIQYLVEKLGFTAVALETSLGESRAAYDFVNHGTNGRQAQLIARESLSWGFGEYVENAELIRWLRDYNAGSAHVRKVHFYGIDLSGADHHGTFSNARGAVDRSLEVLRSVEPAQAEEIRARIEPALELFSDRDYAQLPPAQDKDLERALRSIAEALGNHRNGLLSGIPRDAYEWTLQDLVGAQRLQRYFRAGPRHPVAGDEIWPSGYLQDEVRDAAMADNVRWVLTQEGADGRVVVFAHNAHVMNSPLRGGIWSVYKRAPRAMGQDLRAMLGDRLTIIGTLASKDSRAPSPALAADSAEAALARVGPAPFLLSLHDSACNARAVSWLLRRRSIRANVDTVLDVELARAFDAVFFLEQIGESAR